MSFVLDRWDEEQAGNPFLPPCILSLFRASHAFKNTQRPESGPLSSRLFRLLFTLMAAMFGDSSLMISPSISDQETSLENPCKWSVLVILVNGLRSWKYIVTSTCFLWDSVPGFLCLQFDIALRGDGGRGEAVWPQGPSGAPSSTTGQCITPHGGGPEFTEYFENKCTDTSQCQKTRTVL